jgi:hypothetical protein
MPHDPVTTRQDVLPKSSPGGNDRVVLTQYEAPATADGGIGEDLRKEYDEWAAREVMKTLEAEYPGHHWRVIHDSAQGVCLISIPILMGVNRFMAVNLKTHALDSHRVKLAGGEILERYGLLRGRFQLTPFLEAREKHSALVMPSRKVPG